MKKILIFAVVLVLALYFTACNESGNNYFNTDNGSNIPGSTSANNESKEKVTSDGYDKFSQLEIGMTESQVNAILGEPTRVDKAYHYYNVTVNGNDLELEVWINTVSGLVTYISGHFNKDEYRTEFADSATDLSCANNLKTGEINTYDACVNAFKTPGYLMNIDENGVKEYLWVNANDGYMTVTFRADGTVKTYGGFC
ncbi:MAG: outer membrane protein assembly factor BamE [Clostridiales bacterium]|nr:outer membrane protein assembly factor BamE [Clostridiales bacterium]